MTCPDNPLPRCPAPMTLLYAALPPIINMNTRPISMYNEGKGVMPC